MHEQPMPSEAAAGTLKATVGTKLATSAMRWAGKADHLGGIPRALVIASVGALAKMFTSFLNSTHVHNAETLQRLVHCRSPDRPLITVSNHMSTLDDPLMWGFKGFPTMNAKLARWVLAAEDICFKNAIYSYLFRLGKCIPITRGGGIYQDNMNEALDVLINGGWLHTFPEGKICQESVPIRRLKWGTASLIARAPVTPLVLPIVHCGFEKVMPEKYKFDRRPLFPLINKHIKIIVGEPLEFDVESLRQKAKTMSHESSSGSLGWPHTSPDGLSVGAQRWLYANISDEIRNVMERLRTFGMAAKKLHF
ncbi:N-acylphosphatidylethanolamine synthase isoform X2 [Phalaenopsis equestris]|uniref:N-acylphosphatidylethanolamine synthase isoform X2 n=1 Tax=Phalaenopsis equestris TaxID=78828 RepID=UPI0009E1D3CC|nr:N-acylphosphatidylethanolamine synthase isoform X2 [Phalaenopsis equestris]